MKRKAKGKVLYRKTSPGTLILRKPNRRIKPKQVVELSEEEVIRWEDQFEEVSEGKVKKEKKKAKKKEKTEEAVKDNPPEEYAVEHTGGGYYDVLSKEGKVMNEEKLKKAEAQELKAILETEQTQEDD